MNGFQDIHNKAHYITESWLQEPWIDKILHFCSKLAWWTQLSPTGRRSIKSAYSNDTRACAPLFACDVLEVIITMGTSRQLVNCQTLQTRTHLITLQQSFGQFEQILTLFFYGWVNRTGHIPICFIQLFRFMQSQFQKRVCDPCHFLWHLGILKQTRWQRREPA